LAFSAASKYDLSSRHEQELRACAYCDVVSERFLLTIFALAWRFLLIRPSAAEYLDIAEDDAWSGIVLLLRFDTSEGCHCSRSRGQVREDNSEHGEYLIGKRGTLVGKGGCAYRHGTSNTTGTIIISAILAIHPLLRYPHLLSSDLAFVRTCV
jgi:hypothetical protein